MLTFIAETISEGGAPVSFTIRPMLFGTESEYRWKKYHNSKYECLKVEYNLPPVVTALCSEMLRSHASLTRTRIRTRIVNGTVTNQILPRRPGE
jgi:hypothetical protein